MRIAHIEGHPAILRCADIDRDGRSELLVVNTRLSRLDVVNWLPSGERQRIKKPVEPNALPMAPEFQLEKFPWERLPRDVLVTDVDGDARPDLVMLEVPPGRIATYSRSAAGSWDKQLDWDLLPASFAGRDRLLLAQRDAEGGIELLVSCVEGIQRLALKKDARAAWLTPRESVRRLDWWLADLDGDGDQDVVEWARMDNQSLRWCERIPDQFLPASPLFKKRIDDVAIEERRDGAAHVYLLGTGMTETLRRWQLQEGDSGPLGAQEALPLAGENALWTATHIDEQPAIVIADTAQPSLILYRLLDEGWSSAQTFPGLRDVAALAAPAARPGSVLLWTKDASDLQISHWKDGRLSFPRPFLPYGEATAQERRVLGMGSVGTTVWWAQSAGAALELFVWEAKADQPQRHIFATGGEKAERVVWMGESSLILKEKYARGLSLLSVAETGEPQKKALPHLRKALPSEFVLVPSADHSTHRRARMTNGVLQWLGPEMHPEGQVMLPDGLALVSFTWISDHEAWALQAGGQRIHRLEADDAGILRLRDSYELPGGERLHHDPVLGLLLLSQQRLVRLSPGRPRELVGRESYVLSQGLTGDGETDIENLWLLDITGDGNSNLIAVDDDEHRLAVFETGDMPRELISWQVFDDNAGFFSEHEDNSGEPRALVAADIDGDGLQDLAQLCSDRLLIYLARKEGAE